MNRNQHNMPTWAQKVDSYGKSRWNKEKGIKSGNGEYIGAILFNLLFLWVVNHITEWHLGFIRDNFPVVQWILTVSIMIKIAGNSVMLVFQHRKIRNLSIIMIEIASFITQMVLFYIYPFNFSNFHGLFWIDWFLPVAFIIGMIISAIKVVSNLWKLIFRD
jgi:hypothetical protein